MSESTQQEHAEPPPRNPTVGFEPRDVNVKGIAWFVVGLAVLIVVSVLAVFGIYTRFERERARETRTRFPVAEAVRREMQKADPAGPLPPSPRLGGLEPLPPGQPAGRISITPVESARAYYDAQEARLESWGWNDKGHSTAHIPIAEARDRLLAKPGEVLKGRPGSKPVAWDKEGGPRETNSGRSPPGGDK